MSKRMLVTTTSTIQGYEIAEYYGYISANFVTGADFILDFFAGFTDFFGGISGAYTNEVDALKAMAVDSLELKAEKLGMNGIVGLKIDIDPIFGGTSRSMFMVSASGTAVLIDGLHENLTDEEKRKRDLLSKIRGLGSVQEVVNIPNKFESCTAQDMESFLNGLTEEEAPRVIDMVLEYCKNNLVESFKWKIQSKKKLLVINDYLKNIPRSKYIDSLNGKVTREKAKAMRMLEVIDYSNILNELKLSKSKDYDLEIIGALGASPQIIEEGDGEALGEIIKILNERYNKNVDIKKVGMINKKDMWLCKKCNSPIELSDNKCSICLIDRYGLPANLKYELKIAYLESLHRLLVKY